jgi:hypothetical protein
VSIGSAVAPAAGRASCSTLAGSISFGTPAARAGAGPGAAPASAAAPASPTRGEAAADFECEPTLVLAAPTATAPAPGHTAAGPRAEPSDVTGVTQPLTIGFGRFAPLMGVGSRLTTPGGASAATGRSFEFPDQVGLERAGPA